MRCDGTIDEAEAVVLGILRDGPCATSGHTENGRYRFVTLRTCRRLALVGLVVIDNGGWASLTEAGVEAVTPDA